MARRKSSIKAPVKGKQTALVVGVSKYPNPADHLPGVATDVREMAKVLSSKDGTFASSGVTVLTDKQATKSNIKSALRQTFTTAASGETVFVYLAGHGDVVGDDYFFISFDTDGARLNETGVSLKEIKTLFDQTKARRVFLWLDFCHSGGILARRISSDARAIERAIGVVSGEGRIIVAACTSSQLAYEDPSIGHGLFTHALLKGLKGEAKSARGEVTALSLYDYIDHEVGSTRQQPVFFGEMTGRIVLMHYGDRTIASKTTKAPKKSPATKKPIAKKKGDWVMLGDNFFQASTIRHRSEGKIELAISPSNTEDEAALSSLRPSQYGGRSDLPFSVNNDAHSVRVEHVETETTSGHQVWKVTLKISDQQFGSGFGTETTYNTAGKTYSPADIAELRVRRLLLNDPAPTPRRSRGFGDEMLLEGMIEGSGSRHSVKECVIRGMFNSCGRNSDWKEFARLRSVFLLKATGTVEHILELKIGAVRGGKVSISFRGRRPQRYSSVAPETIEVKGSCSLD